MLQDDPRVSAKICIVIGDLATPECTGSEFSHSETPAIIVQNSEGLCDALLQAAFREESGFDNGLSHEAFSALLDLTRYNGNMMMLGNLLERVIRLLDDVPVRVPQAKRESVYNGILMCMTFCLNQIETWETKVETGRITAIFDRIILLFQHEMKAFPDGLHCMLPIIRIMGKDFTPYVTTYWAAIFYPILDAPTDLEMMKAIFDVMGHLNEYDCLNSERYQIILDRVLDCINDKAVHSEFKPQLFSILGAMSFKYVHIFNNRVGDILGIFEHAYRAAINPDVHNDENISEYYESFQTHIIEGMGVLAYEALGMYAIHPKGREELYNHLRHLEEFIFETCDGKWNPTLVNLF
jgi:hypothetical protein